jgi:hypothetical protein
MTFIRFAPKWPRLARLSLALATLAAPVCTFAQFTDTPKYTVVDRSPIVNLWNATTTGAPAPGSRKLLN